MSDRRGSGGRALILIVLVLTLALVTACDSDAGAGADDEPAAARPTPTRAAEPPSGGKQGACYRIGFDKAVAPTTTATSRNCDRPHTTETYRVGELQTTVDGHLLAIDSDHVRSQPAEACPQRLSRFVGGDEADLRLSMIRPVWFTPSVEQSDAGAHWFRCDAVVLADADSLAERTGTLRGLLDRPAGQESVAMCGTAAPDSPDFERVLCSADHAWRAISVVSFPAGAYPGVRAAQARGATPCEDAAAERAADPLTFRWSYEWPTRARWVAGQQFGRCWVPD